MEFKETNWENIPEWNIIEFTGRGVSVEVGSTDKDGDVPITIIDDGVGCTVFLTQENIQQLITHLQKQLK